MPTTRTTPHGTGNGPGSHLCPITGCRQHVSPDRLMCRPHWYQVPKHLRDTVWATWQSGAGTGTPAHTDAILAAITAAAARRDQDMTGHRITADPGPGQWDCARCGDAWYGTPPETRICPTGCQPATTTARSDH